MRNTETTFALPNIPNLREVGGFYSEKYKKNIRGGILLRSPSLQMANVEDINLLVNNNLKLVVDLRSEYEIKEEGNGVAQSYYDQQIITYKNLPLLSNSEWEKDPVGSLVDYSNRGNHYLKYLQANQLVIKDIFDSILDHSIDGKASIIHCAFGKDRTGVISAVIQDLLGADKKLVVNSFTESHLHVENLVKYFANSRTYKRDIGTTDLSYMKPKKESVIAFLELFYKEIGGANKFLTSLSIEQIKIERFLSTMFL
jgi:hypothetical protein